MFSPFHDGKRSGPRFRGSDAGLELTKGRERSLPVPKQQAAMLLP